MADGNASPARDPHADLEAERSVLGTVLLDNRVMGKLATIVRDEDFSVPIHALLWQVMLDLHCAQEAIDVVTVVSRLRRMDRLNTIGGAQFLGEVTDGIITTAHVESHARLVAAHARCRRARLGYQEAVSVIDMGGDPDVCLADARGRARKWDVEKPARRRTMLDHAVHAWSSIESAAEGKRLITPTGFRGFDGTEAQAGVTGGMHPGQLWLLAADQGFGKTTWAMQVARYVASQGLVVLVFSLEMTGDSLALRMACGDIGVSMQDAVNGRLSSDDMGRLGESMQTVSDLSTLLVIDDCETMEDIESECLAAFAENDRIGLIVIDYAQIVRPSAGYERKTTTDQISHTSRTSKRLAKRGRCPLLLLSQFSREGQKAEREPVPRDLKGSGSLESDADVIVFLWQERGQERQREEAMQGIVAKNRMGDVGKVPMVFERYRTRFSEPEGDAGDSSWEPPTPPARGPRVTVERPRPSRPESSAPQLAAPAANDTGDDYFEQRAGEGLPNEEVVFPGERSGPLFMADGTTDTDDPFRE